MKVKIPILKDNNFGGDMDAERGDKLLLMQTNIDTHTASTGVTGALLA